jgi:hypothetical protein
MQFLKILNVKNVFNDSKTQFVTIV